MKKINLGCGENKIEGFINVDYYKSGADVECDLNKPDYPFEDNSVDFIKADCVLEHIRNLNIFVNECLRILKPKGKIEIKCDHAAYILLYISKNHEHNLLLNKNYSIKEKEDERIGADSHCHLFVDSHLRQIFSKFKDINITYPKVNHKWYKTILLNLLPFKLGKQHIQMEAVKGESQTQA